MKEFKNKQILISPYSIITKRLATYLESNLNVKIIGYIDTNVVGDKIYKVHDIDNLIFDDILIFSPNHFKIIYQTMQQYIPIKRIYKIDLIDNKYIAYNNLQITFLDFKYHLVIKYEKTKKSFLKSLSYFIDKLHIKRDLVLFISEDFIDANMKHLFLYYIKNNQKAMLLTNNSSQLKELKKYNLPVSKLFSFKGYFYTAFAKIIYLDHFIIDYLEYTSKSQITIQLWHGIGPKPMQDRSRFTYKYFSSPSEWINETVSKKIFKANKFLNLGYPRNDILLRNEETVDLLLCDMNIYNSIHENKKNNMKIVLYMPTFRENGFSKFPLNFKTLNKSMKEQNIKFYVKLHPYVLSKYRDTIKEQTFSNIVFYNTAGDIYPILKYIDILITDYSSIAYDFLLLNKPIIFFNYDYVEYKQVREVSAEKAFLLDYEKDTPGEKVQTQIELVNEMIKILEGNDLYAESRVEIHNKLFDYTDGNSCSRIYNHMKINS